MAKVKNKPVALPKGTLVYPKIRQPDTGHKYSTGKYQTFIAYEDQSAIDDLEQACSEMIEEAWGDNVDPAEVRRPAPSRPKATKKQTKPRKKRPS